MSMKDRRECTIEHNEQEIRAAKPSRSEWLNTALYKKMFAEQEKLKAWLLDQAPEEILNHAYEYTTREDILLWLEYNDLKSAHAKALLRLPDPLEAVFKDLERLDISHSDVIEDVFKERAKREIAKQREKQLDQER